MGTASPTVSAAGTDLTLSLGVGFSGQYAVVQQKVYLWARDYSASDTGWVQTGTTTPITASSPPIVISGVPAIAAGSPQTFTFTVRRPQGPNSLAYAYFLIHSKATPEVNSCHGFFSPGNNTFILYRDNLLNTVSIPAGSPATAENSQCIVYGTGSGTVSNGATDLVFNVTIALKGVFSTTNKNGYALVSANTGWIQTGTWYPPDASLTPIVASGTLPLPVSGSPQIFTVTGRDPNGAANLFRLYFLVNDNTGIPQNTCHGFYDRATNGIFLYNDALNALTGPLTPGSNATLQNSQCTIHGATSALVSAAGTDLTIRLGISRQGAAAARKQWLYVWAQDNEGNDTGWIENAIWLP